jgi:hypothetical protein
VSLHIATEESHGLLVIHVSGALGLAELDALRSACRGAAKLRIDLSELLTADEEATRLLAMLCDSGAELVAVPPYVDLLIRSRIPKPIQEKEELS